MALPPDEKTLFLSECGRSQLLAFDVGAEGSLSNRRVHASLPSAQGKAFAPPDGICLDQAGAVWAAEPIGKWVLRIDRSGRVDVLRVEVPGAGRP
jgi:sugar lactone lactonase YvrE